MVNKNALNLYRPFNNPFNPPNKNGFNNWFVVLLLIIMAISYFLIQ
jgi:hypothetical protein